MTKKKQTTDGLWKSIEQMVVTAAAMIRPSARMTVAEWAESRRYLNTPSAYVGPWRNSTTPYLIEIMETLTSLDHTGMVIAGPARSGKSDVLFNWLGYTVDCDPADIRVYLQTKVWAEDWSQGDLEKTFNARPPGTKQSIFAKNLLPGKHNNTLTRKRFLSGMKLNLSWPAITELSGKTVPRLWLNDYDHMEQDVNKMGNPFDLAKKRATTFKRFGMCVAESTPGFEVKNSTWIANTLHEAPPVAEGILKLYNRGDRRRWYWKCPDCRESFEPSFDLFSYDMDAGSNSQIGKTVHMPCPCCGFKITEAKALLGMNDSVAEVDKTMDNGAVLKSYAEAVDALKAKIPGLADELKKLKDITEINKSAWEGLMAAFKLGDFSKVAEIIKLWGQATAGTEQAFQQKQFDSLPDSSKKLVDRIIYVEGGQTKASDTNKSGSSAQGIGQFTERTFLPIFNQLFPALKDLTDAQKLEYRYNISYARPILEEFTKQNQNRHLHQPSQGQGKRY